MDDIRSTGEKNEKLSPSRKYYKQNDFQTEEITCKGGTMGSRGKITSLSTEMDSGKYEKLEQVGTNNKKSLHDNYEKGPLSPKMATYDGKTDWRPYFLQFTLEEFAERTQEIAIDGHPDPDTPEAFV
jgi:hypothetical protein